MPPGRRGKSNCPENEKGGKYFSRGAFCESSRAEGMALQEKRRGRHRVKKSIKMRELRSGDCDRWAEYEGLAKGQCGKEMGDGERVKFWPEQRKSKRKYYCSRRGND